MEKVKNYIQLHLNILLFFPDQRIFQDGIRAV